MLPRDARYYQIATLFTLLLYGVGVLGFDISFEQIAYTLSAALITQWFCSRVVPIPFDPKSALISALSLCLLLRTGMPWIAVLVAWFAITSKFLLRVDGKHLFNPTNIALVAASLLSDQVWISPGQWGSVAWFAFLLAAAGTLVITRARIWDITCAFLLTYAALLFARAAWLGDPLSIPLHQMHSGALLLFAFFMISDPKTIPERRPMRILFAALTAYLAVWLQFRLYLPTAILYALAMTTPLVPLMNRLRPGVSYQWPTPQPVRPL